MEAVPGETGAGTVRTPGWRVLLRRLAAGVKACWARKGKDRSAPPGRDLEQMLLTYASGDEPIQNEVSSCAETHQRCSTS